MAKIVVREGDSIERALKQFKRLCEKEGLRRSIKRSSYYEKPSEQRRRRKMQMIRERRKAILREARSKIKGNGKNDKNDKNKKPGPQGRSSK